MLGGYHLPQNAIVNRESNFPRLILLEQSPPVKESEDGEELDYTKKRVHVVVKNVPFTIKLGLKQDQSSQINLNHLMFEGKLLYDTDEAEDKEVDYVSVNPIELRRFVNQEGSEVKLQLRIKVLSSHHENLLFRVRIQAVNPNSNKEFYSQMTVLSEPIKVISKPERVKKTSSNASLKKKKNPEDQIRDVVTTIEQLQQEQKLLVESLAQWKNNRMLFNVENWKTETPQNSNNPLSFSNSSNSSFGSYGASSGSYKSPINFSGSGNFNTNAFNSSASFNSAFNTSGGYPTSEVFNNMNISPPTAMLNNSNSSNNIITNNNMDSMSNNNNNNNNTINNNNFSEYTEITSQSIMFDSAFENFLIMYNTLNIDERPAKIRKIIRNSSHKDLEHLSEFLQILSTEGVKENKQSCSCAICPYQYKLFQMEKEPFLPDGDWDADLPLM